LMFHTTDSVIKKISWSKHPEEKGLSQIIALKLDNCYDLHRMAQINEFVYLRNIQSTVKNNEYEVEFLTNNAAGLQEKFTKLDIAKLYPNLTNFFVMLNEYSFDANAYYKLEGPSKLDEILSSHLKSMTCLSKFKVYLITCINKPLDITWTIDCLLKKTTLKNLIIICGKGDLVPIRVPKSLAADLSSLTLKFSQSTDNLCLDWVPVLLNQSRNLKELDLGFSSINVSAAELLLGAIEGHIHLENLYFQMFLKGDFVKFKENLLKVLKTLIHLKHLRLSLNGDKITNVRRLKLGELPTVLKHAKSLVTIDLYLQFYKVGRKFMANLKQTIQGLAHLKQINVIVNLGAYILKAKYLRNYCKEHKIICNI